ncbi:MAG: hypothetical protein IKL70_07795 [Oscillospiraceae bacterium]|nr:hypothetical protein [Oscillospiraceae bacterium]
MKYLLTALFESLALFISIGIVFFAVSKISGEPLPYSEFNERYPDTPLTIASTRGKVPYGQKLSYDYFGETEFRKKNPDTVLTFPGVIEIIEKNEEMSQEEAFDLLDAYTAQVKADFMNREISVFKANVISLYPIITFVSGIICYIGKIGWPIRKLNGLDTSYHIEMSEEYERRAREFSYGSVGYNSNMATSGIIFLSPLIKIAVGVCISLIWGVMLPVLIPINIVLGIISLIFKLICSGFFTNDTKIKRNLKRNKSGKEHYSILLECGYFAVTGNIHKEHRVYFCRYGNAVIAQRILECEEEGRQFGKEDARITINIINEKEYIRYLIKSFMQFLTNKLSKKKQKKESEIYTDIRNKNYFFSATTHDDQKRYIMKYKNNDNHVLFKHQLNMKLMMRIMYYDSNDKNFETDDWNKWLRDYEGY